MSVHARALVFLYVSVRTYSIFLSKDVPCHGCPYSILACTDVVLCPHIVPYLCNPTRPAVPFNCRYSAVITVDPSAMP